MHLTFVKPVMLNKIENLSLLTMISDGRTTKTLKYPFNWWKMALKQLKQSHWSLKTYLLFKTEKCPTALRDMHAAAVAEKI